MTVSFALVAEIFCPAAQPTDVEGALKSIFSPEAASVLSAEQAASLDVNHDGVVSLEDLDRPGLPRWKTLFVAPQSPKNIEAAQPLGSRRNPFILTQSSEADFYGAVRNITFGVAPCNAEIIFLPGIYTRVQLLLRNADTIEENPQGHFPRSIPAVIDRKHPVRLFLRSLYPLAEDAAHTAYFFGGNAKGDGTADLLKYGPALRLKSDALDGEEAMFLQIEGATNVPDKRKISGITVSGLKISGYRSGIDLLFAEKIVLKNNRFETIGSVRNAQERALPDPKVTALYGKYAIGMARLCDDILVKNNRIAAAWNRYDPPDLKRGGDMGLIHAFYIINSEDVVYMDNHIENTSGPQFKVVNTAIYNPDGTVSGVMTGPSRQVLIGNHFLQSTHLLAGIYPDDPDTMAMIHDNSAQVQFWPDKKLYTKPSPPAANLIFLGNTWEAKVKTDFLRRESVTTTRDDVSPLPSRFPNWFFEGNAWIGFPDGPRIVERRRGMDPISFRRDITQEIVTNPNETVRFDPTTVPWSDAQSVAQLRQMVLGSDGHPATHASGNPGADRFLVKMVEEGEIAKVSTDN